MLDTDRRSTHLRDESRDEPRVIDRLILKERQIFLEITETLKFAIWSLLTNARLLVILVVTDVKQDYLTNSNTIYIKFTRGEVIG